MSGHIPFIEVSLDETEKEHLFTLIHKGCSNARMITRAPILLKLAQCRQRYVQSTADLNQSVVKEMPKASL